MVNDSETVPALATVISPLSPLVIPLPVPPPSSATINALDEALYFNILPSATPDVLTSVSAFIELLDVTSAPSYAR